ncbi:MAG: hypothetical protein GY774_28020 [Planctomycetes bacterium]|nr:hypothetical protein [Planctomycetota bacterium]
MKIPFLLQVTFGFAIFYGTLGAAHALVSQDLDKQNSHLVENNMATIKSIEKANPDAFSSFNMDTLTCSTGKPGFLLTPISCSVQDFHGNTTSLTKSYLMDIANQN